MDIGSANDIFEGAHNGIYISVSCKSINFYSTNGKLDDIGNHFL